MDILGGVTAILKGDKFCDYFFASLYTRSLLKDVYLEEKN